MRYTFEKFQNELYPGWRDRFRSGDEGGAYCFKPGGDTSLYGTTDIAICETILNERIPGDDLRDEWAAQINRFQDAETGWYRKTYTWNHFREHTTAYAVAALRLLERSPIHPFSRIMKIVGDPVAWEPWIRRRVPWSLIWPGSHIVAGVPAVAMMTGLDADEFLSWYFDWLDREASPRTGFWQRGLAHRIGIIRKPTKHEMGGAFHMYFIYEYAGRGWRYPERIIDQTLALQHENGLWDGEYPYCIDLDGIYNLTRSVKLTDGYRADEIRAACERFLETAARILNDRELLDTFFINTHRLPGALAAIAECAKWYPELVVTPTDWVQSLDTACFI